MNLDHSTAVASSAAQRHCCVEQLFRCADACFDWGDETGLDAAAACAETCLEAAFAFGRLSGAAFAVQMLACAEACERAALLLAHRPEAEAVAGRLKACGAACRAVARPH